MKTVSRPFRSSVAAAVLGLSFLAMAQLTRGQADPPSEGASPETDPLETLSQAQLQEIFGVLSRHYIDNRSLTYEELNRAALAGLLERLSFGATLVEKNGGNGSGEAPFKLHEELLLGKIAYLRPVTFDENEVAQTAKLLEKFQKEKVDTLILDLRAPVAVDEFSRAAGFLDLFTDANLLLFKIMKPTDQRARLFLSQRNRIWDGRLLVLIDGECSSVAETVAAVLNYYSDYLFFGEPTPGKAVEFQEVALDPDTSLRFASAEVLLPDDRSLFRNGVIPDLPAATSSGNKRRIFTESQTKGLERFVFDRQRPRMNEAALVAGDDPELDYYLAKSADLPTPYDKAPLRDGVAQRALEMLITVDFLKLPDTTPAKKKEKKAAAGSPAADEKAKESEPGNAKPASDSGK